MKRITIYFLILSLFPVYAQESNSEMLGELLEKIDTLQSEVNNLRDQNERLRFEFDKFKSQVEKQQELSNQQMPNTSTNQPAADILTPSTAKEVAIIPSPPPSTVANMPITTDQKNLNVPSSNEYFLYSSAMRALQNADYTALRQNLSNFLREYPNGKYASNAKYWVAETYYIAADYKQAQYYYQRVINEHKGRAKYEDSLLKIAYIREARQEWDGARSILQRLATTAKQENLRQIAKKHLKRFKQEGR